MEAIILAGGMGTRLRSVVSDLPKPMAPVKNKPFLEYIFKWVSQYSVTKLILSVGYKAEAISDYFGDKFGEIEIAYAKEESPLGTGGAIKASMSQANGKDVVIINADTYFPVNIDQMVEFHTGNTSMISLALKEMQRFDRYGTVNLEHDGTISRFNEKQYCEHGLINGGIYVVNKKFMSSLVLPEVFSFEKEVLEKMAGVDHNLKGLSFNKPFIDIGVPEDYFRAADIV